MKVSKLLVDTIAHVWKRRDTYGQMIEFDYPDYDGFPKAGRLNSDRIDAIQDTIALFVHFGGGDKRSFVEGCLKYENLSKQEIIDVSKAIPYSKIDKPIKKS